MKCPQLTKYGQKGKMGRAAALFFWSRSTAGDIPGWIKSKKKRARKGRALNAYEFENATASTVRLYAAWTATQER